MSGSRSVRIFVAMPFSAMGENPLWSDVEEIRQEFLEPISREIGKQLGASPRLVIEDEKTSTGRIHKSMFSEAVDADIYIADLTGANANVYLELGVRWALRDGVTIPICQRTSDIKFNASSTRVIFYDKGPAVLRKAIESVTKAAVEGFENRTLCDSPVRDGLPFVQISRSELEDLRAQIERLKAEQAEDLDPIPPAQTEPTAGDEELFTFMDAWAQPVFEAAKTLLGLAMDALRGQDDLAKRDLAILYQRVYDDADRAYSLAFNAAKGLDGSPSPQAAVGDFHRHYQGMVTWIGKGFEHAVLDPDSFWYREWYESDARFMDELRQTAARPGRSALRENLRATGFNEGVRHRLPAPGPRG